MKAADVFSVLLAGKFFWRHRRPRGGAWAERGKGFDASTYSLHCSSFLGLPYRILIIYLVKPKKGTTMETIGSSHPLGGTGLSS